MVFGVNVLLLFKSLGFHGAHFICICDNVVSGCVDGEVKGMEQRQQLCCVAAYDVVEIM